MPFLDVEQAAQPVDLLPGQEPLPTPPNPEEVPQSISDVLAAGARVSGNLATAAYDRWWEPKLPDADPNYRPWNDIAGYEDYAKEFIRAGSKEEVAVIKRRIDEALAASRTVEQAGGWGMTAAVAGGAFDPATLAAMAIPVAPVLAGASRGARIAAGVKGALAVDTASEALLHQQDPTRSLADSGIRVGAGALLTGAFGHLATRIPRAELEAMRRQLQADMHAAPERAGGDSVGAMRAGDNLTLEDMTIAKGGEIIAKIVGRISPINRVLQSSTKAARRLALEIGEVPYKLNMHFKGFGITALETRAVRREMAQRYGVTQLLEDAYGTYAKRVGNEAMSFSEFKVRASRAARNGDQSDIPEAAALARTVRQKILEPDKIELQRLGVLPEEIDLLGAKSYFPRVWDHAMVDKFGVQLRDKLKRHFAGNPPDEVLPDGTTRPSKALDDAELKDIVEQVVAHIHGTTRGIADISTITIPGRLKKRALKIPENEFEEFFVNDFENVMGGYSRAMAPQIEARKAGFAKMNFEDELDAVNDEYNALRANAKSDKAVQALNAEQKAVLRDLKGIILRATNQVGPKTGDKYDAFIKAGRLLRGYNYATKLGGQTLSSFSDYGHIATRYGAVKTNAAMVKFLTNSNFNKMTRADAKRMGVATDWYIDSRTGTLADIGDELGSSKIERAAEWATKKFTRVTGMATWNSVMKALTAALEQDQLVRYLQKTIAAPSKPVGKSLWTRSTDNPALEGRNVISRTADNGSGSEAQVWLEPRDDGTLRVVDAANGMRSMSESTGKGVVTNLYRSAAEEAQRRGLKFTSDDSVTDAAARVWKRLEADGMDVRKNPNAKRVEGTESQYPRWRTDDGSPVFELVPKESAFNAGGLKPFERAKLAEYGLGDEELRRVAKMVEQHADDSEGMWRLRTDAWEDRGAAEAVEDAISKAANIMVIRKGAGDLPLLMDSEAAKTLLQFKSFGMAAVNRILIPVAQGLSHADAATANGFAMMLALGGMTYAAKEYAAGRVPDMSPAQVTKEALNWSGVLGYMPDVWDPLTIATPKSVRQDLRFSKFKDVSAMQTFMGPSFGTGADTLAMISGLADGEGVSQRDLHNVRKAFVPMQNVFYLRRIIDAMEGEMGEAIGAEGATSDQFVDRITKTEEPKQ